MAPESSRNTVSVTTTLAVSAGTTGPIDFFRCRTEWHDHSRKGASRSMNTFFFMVRILLVTRVAESALVPCGGSEFSNRDQFCLFHLLENELSDPVTGVQDLFCSRQIN